MLRQSFSTVSWKSKSFLEKFYSFFNFFKTLFRYSKIFMKKKIYSLCYLLFVIPRQLKIFLEKSILFKIFSQLFHHKIIIEKFYSFYKKIYIFFDHRKKNFLYHKNNMENNFIIKKKKIYFYKLFTINASKFLVFIQGIFLQLKKGHLSQKCLEHPELESMFQNIQTRHPSAIITQVFTCVGVFVQPHRQ